MRRGNGPDHLRDHPAVHGDADGIVVKRLFGDQNASDCVMLRRVARGKKCRPPIRRPMLGVLHVEGEGSHSRIDFYRLSAKNDDSFRVDYDGENKVTGDLIEARSCACELCALARADAGSVPMEALEGSILKKDPDGFHSSITMSELERRVGIPGKHHTAEARIGGRMWDIYSALWRVADKPLGFLIVSGTIPRTEQKEFDQVAVENFALVEAWPECLPQ
jgi:hypothetical protein